MFPKLSRASCLCKADASACERLMRASPYKTFLRRITNKGLHHSLKNNFFRRSTRSRIPTTQSVATAVVSKRLLSNLHRWDRSRSLSSSASKICAARRTKRSSNNLNSLGSNLHHVSRRTAMTGAEVLALATSSPVLIASLATVFGIGAIYWYLSEDEYVYDPLAPLDWDRIREEIRHSMYDAAFDDGCCAPLLLRLAFNQAATFSRWDGLGGTNGATLRFEPERSYPHNRGLDTAMLILEPIKKKFPKMSYSDLWVLASYVAIEEMGGPRIEFKFGRTDASDGLECVEKYRFPNFEDTASMLLDWSDRLGLSDREVTCLLGGHSCGRLHTHISGIDGSWTDAQILSTDYFKNLKFIPYVYERRGVEHYFDPANPDIVLVTMEGAFFYCARLMKWAEFYAFISSEVWLMDFATVFKKITEYGCEHLVSTELNLEDAANNNSAYGSGAYGHGGLGVVSSTEIETRLEKQLG